MTLLLLPDVAGMLVLMLVLSWFRNRHEDNRVDGWMLGLTFILLQMLTGIVLRRSTAYPHLMQSLSLDAYLLAAVTFGWAARRDLLPGNDALPYYVLPAVPLFILNTAYGAGFGTARLYTELAALGLVSGLSYILFLRRMRVTGRILLAMLHLCLWLPLLYLAASGHTLWGVYWGLACLYLLVAASFRKQARPDCIGAWVVMASFAMWSMCFLALPFAHGIPAVLDTIERVWGIQKFFVVIGMLLVLLEDESYRRKQEALHDALTGLPNRRLFDDRLKVALERSLRYGRSAAIFAIDLNGFKAINDSYGHQTGDLALSRVAERLRRKVRGADTIARCGGDEFLVIVNDLTRPENCIRIANALRIAVESVTIPGCPELRLSGSIGYAVFPDDADDSHTLCELADLRMYGEKYASEPGSLDLPVAASALGGSQLDDAAKENLSRRSG